MMRFVSASVLVVVLHAAACPVSAYKYQTPAADSALSYNMYEWSLGAYDEQFLEVASHHEYALVDHRQINPPTYETELTPEMLHAALASQFAAELWAGHGGETLAVVTFAWDIYGLQAAFDWWKSAEASEWFGEGDFEWGEFYDPDYDPIHWAYDIRITPETVARLHTGAQGIVHQGSCCAFNAFQSAWHAYAYYSYDHTPATGQVVIDDAAELWNSFNGENGVNSRHSGMAHTATTLSHDGLGDVVISPAVEAFSHEEGFQLDSAAVLAWVEFDTHMDASVDAIDVVDGEDGLMVSEASWIPGALGDVVSFVSFSRSGRLGFLPGLSSGLESRARGRLRGEIGGLGEPPRRRPWVVARMALATESREVYAKRCTSDLPVLLVLGKEDHGGGDWTSHLGSV